MMQHCIPAAAAQRQVLRRRAALVLPALWFFSPPLQARAEEVVASPVRPALKAQAYVALIRRTKEPALQELRRKLGSSDYHALSEALFLSPFDDLRQACYFLPWAVLAEGDEANGVRLEDAYVVVRGAWKAIDDAARAAERGLGDDEAVEAAIGAFESAVGGLEAAVPATLL